MWSLHETTPLLWEVQQGDTLSPLFFVLIVNTLGHTSCNGLLWGDNIIPASHNSLDQIATVGMNISCNTFFDKIWSGATLSSPLCRSIWRSRLAMMMSLFCPHLALHNSSPPVLVEVLIWQFSCQREKMLKKIKILKRKGFQFYYRILFMLR